MMIDQSSSEGDFFPYNGNDGKRFSHGAKKSYSTQKAGER